MDQEKILSTLNEVLGTINEILEAADADRDDAWNAAASAEQAAEEAQNQAYQAKTECENIGSRLNQMGECLERFTTLLAQLSGKPEGSSMQADINRWQKKVIFYAKKGANPAQIAARLEISEFLVNTILNQAKAA